ncbi:hypothetical protein [Allgaiera indica]|uniref:hypothetical protein n=1 Tax=Allgaiera indica TaxID=765699 RepID=UPI0031394E34
MQEVVHSPRAGQDWLTYRDGNHVLPQPCPRIAPSSAPPRRGTCGTATGPSRRNGGLPPSCISRCR